MSETIKYACACGNTHELVPGYLKYLGIYMDQEPRAVLVCPIDKVTIIPAREIYKEYLKAQQPVQT